MIDDIIKNFQSISLSEMERIRLMKRTDTKFVASTPQLERLLTMAIQEYDIQEISGKRNMEYATVYYDSPDYLFYNAHHNGYARRQKVRIRTYVESCQSFLEVKTKDNHDKTHKRRIPLEQNLADGTTGYDDLSGNDNTNNFLTSQTPVAPSLLKKKLSNSFHRITLVNKARTERLTIDTGIGFRNITTGLSFTMPHIAVIELKRDGLMSSPVLEMLRELHIHPSGFSKYCIGEALTNPALRKNRIKPRIRKIMKLSKQEQI